MAVMKLIKGYILGTGIAFHENSPSADTITDSGNGFVESGFSAADSITVSGSSNNDGTYLIDTVVDGTITLDSGDDLTDEAAGAGVTIKTAEVTISPREGYLAPQERKRTTLRTLNNKIFLYEWADSDNLRRWEIILNNISESDKSTIETWWQDMDWVNFWPDTINYGSTYHRVRILNETHPFNMQYPSWENIFEGTLLIREISIS